jgi:hypothetical protein
MMLFLWLAVIAGLLITAWLVVALGVDLVNDWRYEKQCRERMRKHVQP